MGNLLSRNDPYLVVAGSGRRTTHVLLIVVLIYAIYDIGILTGSLAFAPLGWVLQSAFPAKLSGDDGPLAVSVGVLLPVVQNLVIYVWPYLLLWGWLRWYEQRPLASLGLRAGGARRAALQHLRGIAAGMAMAVGWLAIQAATGHLAFEGWLRAGRFGLPMFLALLVTMYLGRAFQIGIEEVLFRGWALQDVGRRYGPWLGVAFSSAFFAAFHFFQPMALLGFGRLHNPWPPILIINIFLWAVLVALWTLRDGSVWAAAGFHAASLWSMAIFGIGAPFGVLDLRLVNPNELTGGVEFAGVFEGLPATALLTVGVVVFVLLRRRRGVVRPTEIHVAGVGSATDPAPNTNLGGREG